MNMQAPRHPETKEVHEEASFDPVEIPQLKHDIEQTPFSDAEKINVRVRDNIDKISVMFDRNSEEVVHHWPGGWSSLTLHDNGYTYEFDLIGGDGWTGAWLTVTHNHQTTADIDFWESSNGYWYVASYDIAGVWSYRTDVDDYNNTPDEEADIATFRSYEAHFQEIYQSLLE